MQCGLPNHFVGGVGSGGAVIQHQHPVPIPDRAGGNITAGVDMGAALGGDPLTGIEEILHDKRRHAHHNQQGKQRGYNGASGYFLHAFALLFALDGRDVAKLAFWRVSAALTKASIPQALIILEPPLDRNGNVTPVKGR